MAKKTYRQAINEALAQEMQRDPTVVVMGEDNAGGMGAPGEDDAWGGVLGVTKGLMPEFGRERVLDTPISESAFIGAAIASIPEQHETVIVNNKTYYYSDGVYYQDAPSGSGYQVAEAPQGAAVQQLPEQTVNVNVSNGDTVQYANGAYYEEKPPEKEGADPSYEVIDPPVGATVPYVPEGAETKTIGGTEYFISGNTYYKAFYSGSDVVYMVSPPPQQG